MTFDNICATQQCQHLYFDVEDSHDLY